MSADNPLLFWVLVGLGGSVIMVGLVVWIIANRNNPDISQDRARKTTSVLMYGGLASVTIGIFLGGFHS